MPPQSVKSGKTRDREKKKESPTYLYAINKGGIKKKKKEKRGKGAPPLLNYEVSAEKGKKKRRQEKTRMVLPRRPSQAGRGENSHFS